MAVQKMQAAVQKTRIKQITQPRSAQSTNGTGHAPPVPAVHRTGRSAKLPGGLCVSMERPHRAEGLLWARHAIGRPPRNRGTLLGWAGWDFFPMLGKF